LEFEAVNVGPKEELLDASFFKVSVQFCRPLSLVEGQVEKRLLLSVGGQFLGV
jgi:hypothetical protein